MINVKGLQILQITAREDAMRKRKMRGLSRNGWATYKTKSDRVNVIYYPDCGRFAYFLNDQRVNRSEIEVLP